MLPNGTTTDRGHGRAADAGAEAGGAMASAGATSERFLQDADPWMQKAAKAGGKEWINQYDQNKDGKVTEKEFTSSELQKLGKAREEFSGDLARVFMLADSNNDNRLTMNELTKKIGAKAANAAIKEGDANHDGFLDFGEAKKLFGKEFDANEKLRLHAQFQEFDKNGNGVATSAEAVKAVEMRLRSPGFVPSPSDSPTPPAGLQGGAMSGGGLGPYPDAAPSPRRK